MAPRLLVTCLPNLGAIEMLSFLVIVEICWIFIKFCIRHDALDCRLFSRAFKLCLEESRIDKTWREIRFCYFFLCLSRRAKWKTLIFLTDSTDFFSLFSLSFSRFFLLIFLLKIEIISSQRKRNFSLHTRARNFLISLHSRRENSLELLELGAVWGNLSVGQGLGVLSKSLSQIWLWLLLSTSTPCQISVFVIVFVFLLRFLVMFARPRLVSDPITKKIEKLFFLFHPRLNL